MQILFKSVPYSKEDVTLALESGVDGVIVPSGEVQTVSTLSRVPVASAEDLPSLGINAKADEEAIRDRLQSGGRCVVQRGWEVIPMENLLAQCSGVLAEVASLEEARRAAGILEKGVDGVVVLPEALAELKDIVRQCKVGCGRAELVPATVTRVERAGLGHRVCVDTLSLFSRGQGMLVGNTSGFLFLVHAETEPNEYVAARPFRVNAGAVHAYIRRPGDRTSYLEELRPGAALLAVDAQGREWQVTAGRIKTEVRPMLLIEAETEDKRKGVIFLQDAETIRLTAPDGTPLSVVTLRPGDTVLCALDEAGRHFGMRIREDIREA